MIKLGPGNKKMYIIRYRFMWGKKRMNVYVQCRFHSSVYLTGDLLEYSISILGRSISLQETPFLLFNFIET